MASAEQEYQSIAVALRALREQWAGVRRTWQDSGADKFEVKYVAVLDNEVQSVLPALGRAAQAIAAAQRCP